MRFICQFNLIWEGSLLLSGFWATVKNGEYTFMPLSANAEAESPFSHFPKGQILLTE